MNELAILKRMDADERAYKAGKLPKLHVRRIVDESGNLIRQKARVYYGESFDEALARELAEGKQE